MQQRVTWQECTYFVCGGGGELVMCGWSINVHVLIQTHITAGLYTGGVRGGLTDPPLCPIASATIV